MAEVHDPRISEIFYYFSKHTDIKSGRTVGRKIGVVQEILIKKMLLQDEQVRDCLIYEPKLRGKSGATHKVEFVLFLPVAVFRMTCGGMLRINDPSLEISLRSCDEDEQTGQISIHTGEKKTTKTLGVDQAFQVNVVWDGKPRTLFVKLVSIDGPKARISILNGFKPLASLESKRVGAQRFSSSDKLGSGIQTIEKAKQTSLVAIDFDLLFNDGMLVASAPDDYRPFRSFALLGNGVHWTDHDLSVLQTYVDYTFQVKDEAIIRYAEFVRGIATSGGVEFFDFFMEYFYGMTVTPADAFAVDAKDFLLLRPAKGKAAGSTLLDLVKAQIPSYKVEEF